MPHQTLVRLIAIAFLLALCLPFTAAAQDEEPGDGTSPAEASGWQKRFDAWVGENIVEPLNKVLFFPIYSRIVPIENVQVEITEAGEDTEEKGKIRAASADGRRIIIITEEGGVEGGFEIVVSVPAEQMPELERLLADENDVEVSTIGDRAEFTLSSFNLGKALLEGSGPDYELTITRKSDLPFIVVVLVLGGLFYTIRYGFLNVRLFGHAIAVVRGKFDDPDAKGEVSHFRALTAALSATVGLGNISGVAIAITVGGAGAVFWMWLTAFFGMSMKFSSCVCAQVYRQIHEDGRVLGGPMVYLREGIKERFPKAAFVGKGFAALFAVLAVFSAFGGGNMYQVNQTVELVASTFFNGSESSLLRLGLGAVIAVLTGFVIIGGITRIGEVTAKLVPAMCLFYCSVCLIIILMNVGELPSLFASIFSSAFQSDAMFGGFIGVLVVGMRRAAFSNEAGIGSASIAQAAAKTVEPVQAGAVAMLGPFIDTIIVCTMTALAILITKSHIGVEGLGGINVTAQAFAALGWAVPYVLCLAVFVFAYSTLISWGYYGERAIEYLFGPRGVKPYRVVYVLMVVVGPLLSLEQVLNFSDALLLSMAFPNIIGMLFLSGKVKGLVVDYLARLKSGAIHRAEA